MSMMHLSPWGRRCCHWSSMRSRIQRTFSRSNLYDAIQPNEQLIVQYEPDDERILEGEQGRARRAVQAWFANR